MIVTCKFKEGWKKVVEGRTFDIKPCSVPMGSQTFNFKCTSHYSIIQITNMIHDNEL